jgi:acyl dehydratase
VADRATAADASSGGPVIRVRRGRHFEDFEIGRVFHHPWSRTVLESDNMLFNCLTLSYNPINFSRLAALDAGYRDIPVNPYLVFLTVFGLSVEDLSEGGGGFLGVNELSFVADVFPGDTVRAESEVLSRRASSSRPDTGVVTWRTTGLTDGGPVIIYERTNLVRMRNDA